MLIAPIVVGGCDNDTLLSPVPPEGVTAFTCHCDLPIATQGGVLGVPAICNITRCDCAALATGACAQPRDDAQCQIEVADAVDSCEIIFGQTPPRPDPAGIDLGVLDALCAHLDSQGCQIQFEGDFCAGPEEPITEIDRRCRSICGETRRFMDFGYSRQSSEYPCDTIGSAGRVVNTFRKAECSQTCAPDPCTTDNIDECTLVAIPSAGDLPPGDLGHCQLGHVGSEPFCRTPDSDPPVLNAGGILAEMTTRRARAIVDPANSEVIVPVGNARVHLPLSGHIDILGEPVIGEASFISVRMSLHGAGQIHFDGSVLDDFQLSAGTGTAPVVEVNLFGLGAIVVPQLSGTLSMKINNVTRLVSGVSLGALLVNLDRAGRTLQLNGSVSFWSADKTAILSAALNITASIRNQPPRAVTATEVVVGCTDPTATPVDLIGEAVDLDGIEDIVSVEWRRASGPSAGSMILPWSSASTTAALGANSFEMRVQDSWLQEDTARQIVTVINSAPIANAGPDQVIECTSPAGAIVQLDATSSFDPEGTALAFEWRVGGASVGDSAVAQANLSLGTTTVELTVVDGCGGSATDSVDVTVVDTTPPALESFAATGPLCLWPPNHEYVVLRVGRDFNGVVADMCDPDAALVVTSVESNQPDDARGDGATTTDAVAFADRVCLRTERQGLDPGGRTYRLHLAAVDASGNTSDPVLDIRVPHDQSSHDCPRLSGVELVDDANDPRCIPATGTADTAGAAVSLPPPSAKGGCAATGGGWLGLVAYVLVLAVRRRRAHPVEGGAPEAS